MKKTKLLLSSTFTALAIPMLAFAQNPSYINNWVFYVQTWIKQGINIIMIAMTLWFLISVLRYIAEKDPKEIVNKRAVMIQSLIGLFVAVSVWGIIAILGSVFGTNTTGVNLGNPIYNLTK